MRLILPAQAPTWMQAVLRSIENLFRQPMSGPFRLKSYTVLELPDAADWRGGLVYVSNEIGGATPAFSNGTNWLRVSDLAIVS